MISRRLPLGLLLLLLSMQALSIEVAGINVPESSNALRLQGAGLRTKFMFDVYVGAFYANGVLTTAAAALRDTGPREMHFYFLRNISSKQIKTAWLEGIEENNSSDEISKNKILINDFVDLFDKDMGKGDIMMVDYIPGKGTQVFINGKIKGVIAGEHFFELVLSVWMGEHPPSQKFRQALLSS